MRKLVFGLILALGVSLFPSGAHADTVSDEASFVAKINDLRMSKGLPALEVNGNLVAKARDWAAGMAAAGRIWHSTLSDGITLDWQKLGENVGMGGSVDGLEAAFVASPHHYENMVDPNFGYVGIGIAKNSSGTLFVSEVFMQLMPAKVAVTLPPVTAPRVTTTSAPVTTSTSAPKPPAPKPVPRPVPPAPTPVVAVAVQAPVPPPAPPAAVTPPPPPPAAPEVTPADPPRAPSDLLVSVLERLRSFDS
jgi:hypothetical protein